MSEEERFAFGKNWHAFLAGLDEERIDQAVHSLRETLGSESLDGKRFLDLGCGSGLFSLAAHRLGADVVSVDCDAQCVACAQELRGKFASDGAGWRIQQGSVLDKSFMQSLGDADVVYSWGVLHHTGDMDRAIGLAADRTKPGGRLMIAIYNDQGGASRRWLRIKRTYNRLPGILRPLWVVMIAGFYEAKFALARLAKLQNPLPFRQWREKRQDRGMSVWHDWVDWIGGLPFEVAKPERIIVPLRRAGFVLENLKTVGSGWGCNEYVFSRSSA
jgi:2-polyprenyl-6-hydroxyphenyl methylase/3-demethylubiquinone-9 3-methyltransferase